MAVRTRSRDLSGEQRRALDILAGSPLGCTEDTLAGARVHGQAACQHRARRLRDGESGDRESRWPDAQHAAADDQRPRAAGARQYVAAGERWPRMRPVAMVVRWRVVRCSNSDGEAEPPAWRAPLGNTGF
jgi:hypothetical protein